LGANEELVIPAGAKLTLAAGDMSNGGGNLNLNDGGKITIYGTLEIGGYSHLKANYINSASTGKIIVNPYGAIVNMAVDSSTPTVSTKHLIGYNSDTNNRYEWTTSPVPTDIFVVDFGDSTITKPSSGITGPTEANASLSNLGITGWTE
jgi:hypothetical protein